MGGIEPGPDPYADAPPAPENSNSIRIMTIHASKGLEAPVVFVCGGFSRLKKPLVYRSTAMGSKRVFLSDNIPEVVQKDVIASEREEDEKLLYVALTRASVKLYLPFIDSDASIKGMYELLNQRLQRLSEDGRLMETSFIMEPKQRPCAMGWMNQPTRQELPDHATILSTLSRQPKVWIEAQTPITSYSSLKQHQKSQLDVEQRALFLASEQIHPTELDPESVPIAPLIGETEISETLVGGKGMGQVLHDCLELIDGRQWMGLHKDQFIASTQNTSVAKAATEKHRVDPETVPAVLALVWDVLTARLKLNETIELPPLGRLSMLKEMEFLYPAPSVTSVPEGYIRGFIDGLFQFEGKYYWLDWKSDRLLDYSQSSLGTHVETHYGIQAQLYTLALERLLRIENETHYNALMGGLIYVYLRGVRAEHGPSDSGIFFSSPSYQEARTFEREWSKRGLYNPPNFSPVRRGDEPIS